MSVVAIIPARGGSKGIPRKNLRVVGGLPLVTRAVRASLQASLIDRVIVTTDDAEIAAAAAAEGAEIIDRPVELATDEASSESALLHALDALADRGGLDPDVVAMVQCTSPLTTPVQIDGTIELVTSGRADCAFTGSPSHAFLWQKSADGAISVNHDSRTRPRRQDQVPQYADTGAVYAMRSAGLRATGHRFFGRVAIFEVPRVFELEIDDEDDLAIAEALIQAVGFTDATLA